VRWDIFCRVIDNYGDAGVCWRLARQLTTEFDMTVRLLVDNLAVLQQICPEIDHSLALQSVQNVQVMQWTEPFPQLVPADVVIEAFGCELPTSYVATMATNAEKRSINSCWINLEYLSAESWVADYHKLPSPHPHFPLAKYFFFPGFTKETGGLIRETNLLAQRDALRVDRTKLWQELAMHEPTTDEIVVSLFCYSHAPISYLLEAWAASSYPVRCLLPQGVATEQVAEWAGKTHLTVGERMRRGSLTIEVIPFLSQENYDRLLWACDCNFVRGEDSFVRAQWAARSIIWQIYPQQENAHLPKLQAFLDLYCQGLAAKPTAALRALHQAWNSNQSLDWDAYWVYHKVLRQHAVAWADRLIRMPDLTTNLVNFCQNK